MKEKWIGVKAPGYSEAELQSIFQIKQKHSLGRFKINLSNDLLIAEVLAIGFIVILQILDFRTSNFWSLMMLFLAIQHLIIYSLQNSLISRVQEFSGNVENSIQESISKLNALLMHYRIWPVLLSIILYTVYVSQFASGWSITNTALIGAALAIGTLILSNSLSALLVRNQLQELQKLARRLDDLRTQE